jgi:TDG/mug DNA glycosylase family protein
MTTQARTTAVPQRPSREQLAAASGRTVPDVVAPGLRVLFCGINPGLYSGATGHHFARPGNRFWAAIHGAGLTSRLLQPDEERELLDAGLGITNLVARSTASAAELDAAELQDGARRLARTVARLRPELVAVLGISAYRTAFERPHATFGEQPEGIADARLWVLPNPSGLNAHFQLRDFVASFAALHVAIDRA